MVHRSICTVRIRNGAPVLISAGCHVAGNWQEHNAEQDEGSLLVSSATPGEFSVGALLRGEYVPPLRPGRSPAAFRPGGVRFSPHPRRSAARADESGDDLPDLTLRPLGGAAVEIGAEQRRALTLEGAAASPDSLDEERAQLRPPCPRALAQADSEDGAEDRRSSRVARLAEVPGRVLRRRLLWRAWHRAVPRDADRPRPARCIDGAVRALLEWQLLQPAGRSRGVDAGLPAVETDPLRPRRPGAHGDHRGERKRALLKRTRSPDPGRTPDPSRAALFKLKGAQGRVAQNLLNQGFGAHGREVRRGRRAPDAGRRGEGSLSPRRDVAPGRSGPRASLARARVGSHPGYVPEPAARAHDAGDGPPRAAPWVAGSGRSARARCSAFALRRSTFYSVPSTPGTPKGGTLGPIAQFTAPTRATTALAVYRENHPEAAGGAG